MSEAQTIALHETQAYFFEDQDEGLLCYLKYLYHLDTLQSFQNSSLCYTLCGLCTFLACDESPEDDTVLGYPYCTY
jgi:hypothetical protein